MWPSRSEAVADGEGELQRSVGERNTFPPMRAGHAPDQGGSVLSRTWSAGEGEHGGSCRKGGIAPFGQKTSSTVGCLRARAFIARNARVEMSFGWAGSFQMASASW